jgi:FkbM family methyltransferase
VGARLSETTVKILMRGIGINVGYGLAESGERWLVVRLLAACKQAVCADVGANVGDYTALLVKHGAKSVFAFEPVPATFAELQARMKNVSAVIPIQAAVGERTGVIDIHAPHAGGCSTLATRDPNVTFLQNERFVSHTVPLVTLDSVAFERGVRFDFVKIDVEGFELEVLRGAARTISEHPPVAFQFEFNRHHMLRRQHIGDFFDALPGYRLFRLAPRSLFPLIRGHYLSTIYTFQNLVAVREDRTDVLAALGR